MTTYMFEWSMMTYIYVYQTEYDNIHVYVRYATDEYDCIHVHDEASKVYQTEMHARLLVVSVFIQRTC